MGQELQNASAGGTFTMRDFVRESNRIEGIRRDPYPHELAAHTRLLKADALTVTAIESFVASATRNVDGGLHKYSMHGAPIRKAPGMDVRVGNHLPPKGGPDIVRQLRDLLAAISERSMTPREAHIHYERLHPFMDGNGRSGRAIWLWQMGGIERAPLGFLHHFYYQSLEARQP